MDFSAFNPLASNALNMAARNNEIEVLERLLRNKNPNCVDNRGWTCLHEAAANDRYQCVKTILKHPECRPLAETFEGHTALYLACRNKCSTACIRLLLDSVEHIAQYASTEMVSPLHLACQKGHTELVQLLIEYDSLINLQDFDGDSPLHDAAFASHHEVVSILLHAGAEPELRNTSGYTPFHLACMQGSMECIHSLLPFVTDINLRSGFGDTPLILASHKGSLEIIVYLLKHDANPNLRNALHKDALTTALAYGNAAVFRELLTWTDHEGIVRDIFLLSCMPNYFNLDIISALLESDLGPDYFNKCETLRINLPTLDWPSRLRYQVNPPLNCFLNVANYIYNQSPELFRKLFFLLLMRGVQVDALAPEECPPLVYIHFCDHNECFNEVVQILVDQGCNVDYRSTEPMPDAFLASMATGSHTVPILLQHSFSVEPHYLKKFMEGAYLMINNLTVTREKIDELMATKLSIVGETMHTLTLQHLCRLRIRQILRDCNIRSTRDFILTVNNLPLPKVLANFVRYIQ